MRRALGEDAARLALQPAVHRVADALLAGVARQGDAQMRLTRGIAALHRDR